MKYAYENLYPEQFEQLITLLCQRLFGISVQGFAKGPDGGRDAKFVGTAERHPSAAAPWVGTTIIQAKHTNGTNLSFSELDFFSPPSMNTVIGKEIPRIKKLRMNNQLDHYMLFANRRQSGIAESEIRNYIAQECNIPESSIYLCGLEQLESWLKTFPEVPTLAKIDPVDSPLIISPDDLAVIVEALARNKTDVFNGLHHPPTDRITYDKKNASNSMSADYAEAQLKRYLKETAQIKSFLAMPENFELLQKYEASADELKFKIIANRKDYQSFDKIMEHLVDLLFDRDAVLRQHVHKPVTRAVLFYMYWNCDIG